MSSNRYLLLAEIFVYLYFQSSRLKQVLKHSDSVLNQDQISGAQQSENLSSQEQGS
jgi:hypothetical protein